MGDAAAVVLALAATVGAWVARPVPLLPAIVVIAVALAVRKPVPLVLGVALAASGLGAKAWDGLRPPATGAWSGVATLVGDPAEVAGALRVDVRIGDKRVEAWARGSVSRGLVDRLAGERVELQGQLQPVPAPARSRLARRHVGARMNVTRASLSSAGDVPSRLANGLRRTLLGGAAGMSPGRRALYAGFVLGDDREQRPEVTDDFRASGLSHLLVVSGQNVAFVLALLAPFLKRFRLGGRLVGGLAILILFGILTRWEPSVLRAEAMAALSLLAAAMGRPASAIRLLSLAVTGLVLVDPLLVRSLGFLLSVGACAGIALFSTRIAARLPGPRALAEALGVTLAAQVGVLPVLVPVFGGLPVSALPANLLAVPVAGPLMMWGMAAGLPAGWVGGGTARILHLPTEAMIAWVAGVAHWGATVPLGQLRAAHVGGLAVALVCGVAARRRRWNPGVALAALLAAAVSLAPAVAVLRPSPIADGALVDGARLWRGGGATVVVVRDLKASPEALLSALHQADVRRLDVVVVERPGKAASSDVAALLRRFPPRLLLAPSGHRLQGPVVVPAAGTSVTAGGLVIAVDEAEPRLAVRVGSARAPPGSVTERMLLSLGSRSFDLAARPLVIGLVERADDIADAVANGVDIVEVGGRVGWPGTELLVCATPRDDADLAAFLAAGACLIRFEGGASASASAYALCARARTAVLVDGASGAGPAEAAGVRPDRVVVLDGDVDGPYPVLIDVTASAHPVAATAVGIVRGATIIRTRDVRGSRRVCDTLAAVRGSGR